MKKIVFFALSFILFFNAAQLSSQYYIGAGATYKNPAGSFADYNQPAWGINFQFESRQWCLWWFGLRVDYFSLEKAEDIDIGKDYFESEFTVSPGLRYNFLGEDCYKYNIVPYVQLMLRVSSITGTDELSPLGLGAAAGGGVAYSFSFLNVCSMIDFNALYNSPNMILLDDEREVLQSIDISLSLSFRL